MSFGREKREDGSVTRPSRACARVSGGLLVAILVLGACVTGPDGNRDRPRTTTPVVIDTDAGADDIMAILYLLRRPDIRVKAITVSGTGLAHCEGGIRTVLGLLEVAGRAAVPVACGRETPLGGSNAFPEEWRAMADEGYGLDLPEPSSPPEDDAVALLTTSIGDSNQRVTLLALGPLTNVAEAFTADPDLASEIATLVSMGGALLTGGNVEANPEAEWNFHADPRAVDIVLRSGAPVTLVPLDATNAVPVNAYFVDALAAHHVTPEADTVLALLEGNPQMVEWGTSFWDPLAATVAAGTAPAGVEERRVVVLEGSAEVDGELALSSAGSPVRVATAPDPIAFETELINTLNGDEALTTTRPEPNLTITLAADGCTSDLPASFAAGAIDVQVDNPLEEAGTAVLVRTTRGHHVGELEAFIADLDRAQPNPPPPRWIEIEAWADTPAGETSLTPWVLEPGIHALVCATETGLPTFAGAFEVTG
jgi:pyrimidine-specific ribonucleoside hydrolase